MNSIVLTTRMDATESETRSIELVTYREQQQEVPIHSLKTRSRLSEFSNKEFVRIVTHKLRRKDLSLQVRRRLLQLQMHLSGGYSVFAIFICIAMTVSILTVCITTKQKSNPTCSLTFKAMALELSNQNSNPRSIAIGDFNHDTRLDVVVANLHTHNIGVSLGYGNGSLAKQKTYSTGSDSRPRSVAVGDFNNDRHLDIAVANYGTHSVGIFLGNGNGGFTLSILVSTGASRPLMVAVGDLNNDQQLDFAVVRYGTNDVEIFFQENNGKFSLPQTYPTGHDSIPFSIALVDLNDDRHLDIVVANYGTNTIGVFLGYQNGSFRHQETYSTGMGSRPYSIIVGDFNNDNESDVAVANSGTGNIGLLLGTGRGTFEKQQIFVTDTFGPLYITAGDFNRDNRLDVAIANNWNNRICIILGDGNRSFVNQQVYMTGFGSYPASIGVGDFNSDGRLDIAVANNGTNNIGIFLGYDPGVFESKSIYSTGKLSNPKSIVTGDFNNDKIIDMAVGNNQADNIGVFLGLGDGRFLNQIIYSTGSNSSPSFITVTDFNNDNQLDIVIAAFKTDSVGIFFGYGNGSFTDMQTVFTGNGSSPRTIGIGDFNKDHCMDMVVGKYDAMNIGVFLGYCNGTFADQMIYPTGSIIDPELVLVVDMNNDKQLDIIVVDSFASNFSIFFGYGNGTFRNQRMYASKLGLSATSLAVADFNRDEQLDLVIAYSLTKNIVIFFGNGNERFATEVTYQNDFYSPPYSVSVGDFNNDNISDIVVANSRNDNIGVFFGFVNGTFSDQVTYSTGNGSGPWALSVVDVNNDHRLDIIVTYSISNNVAVLLGDDYGAVRNQTVYTTGAASYPVSVAVGYFNHDRQLDIAIINYGTEELDIRLGYGHGEFSNVVTYSTGAGSLPSSMVLGDFNNDTVLDIAIANFGSNTISIFYGDGNGTFAMKTTLSTASSSRPLSLAMANINNDIWPDLVVVNYGTNTIGIFLGYRYTAFADQITYPVEIRSHPLSVIVDDFNNDTHLDIISSTDGQASGSVYLGYGNGSFQSAGIFAASSFREAQLIASGNFNDDQCLDIVTVNIFQSFFSIFNGHCNGSFENLGIYSSGNRTYPSSMITGDFNNDKLSDIALAISSTDSVNVFLNIGNGTFGNATIYSTGYKTSPNALSKADFNNDSQMDIVVTNYNASSVGIFFGNRDGTFQNQTTYSTGLNSTPNLIAVGDLNNDRWLDIVIIEAIHNRVGVLLAIGNGMFTKEIKYSVTLIDKPSSIAMNDFNNDHLLDIAVTGWEKDTLRLYFGKGDGTFELDTMCTTGDQSSPMSLAIGDFNGDHQQDIAVASYGTSNIGVFLGHCCDPFVRQTTIATGNNSIPQSVAIGDFNNDNRADLVVANSGIDGIGIFLGNGNGTFVNQTTYTTGTGSYPISVAVGDLNNDHRLDIIVANYQNETIGVFFGYGNGTFSPILPYHLGFGSRPYSVAVYDLNEDNQLDIIVSDHGTNKVTILQGYRNASFTTVTNFATGYQSLPFSVAFGDFNGDTLQDIVVALAGASNIGFISKQC